MLLQGTRCAPASAVQGAQGSRQEKQRNEADYTLLVLPLCLPLNALAFCLSCQLSMKRVGVICPPPLPPSLAGQVMLRVVVEPQTLHLLHIGIQHDTFILCPPPYIHLWLCRWC